MIWTIGHSTHSAGAFLALLQAHRIERLADVRTLPVSRRHPQFNRLALQEFLAANGVTYQHMPALGGFRKPNLDSVNTAWKHPAFRGYADYMATAPFRTALLELQVFAQPGPTAVMCAEALWWNCHRRLLADALQARGVPVRHILDAQPAKCHQVSEFARIGDDGVTYPGLL